MHYEVRSPTGEVHSKHLDVLDAMRAVKAFTTAQVVKVENNGKVVVLSVRKRSEQREGHVRSLPPLPGKKAKPF